MALAVCLPLLKRFLAVLGTEAPKWTAIALRFPRCADFLPMANEGDVQAERHLAWNPSVQKKLLSFLVSVLAAVLWR